MRREGWLVVGLVILAFIVGYLLLFAPQR